jgi:23S rRNA pseudouridine1911/1915/1917 synthase
VTEPAAPRREFVTVVPASLEGERVDKAVSLLSGLSRNAVAALVRDRKVRVGEQAVKVRSQTLSAGQKLSFEIPEHAGDMPVADPDVDFAVVHEDAFLVVVDKPPGLVVHRGPGHKAHTLVEGLLARYPDIANLPPEAGGGTDRPGVVHRLDKGTSGLLVVARRPDSYRLLARQFREHSARREYSALVSGTLAHDEGIVEASIGRSARRPDRMAVSSAGKPASTEYSVVERYASPIAATLVRLRLRTGRTHQIRVHLAAIGHPVIGDDRYGTGSRSRQSLEPALASGRLFLHAHRLCLVHPDGTERVWTAELPPDLRGVLSGLVPIR